MIGPNYKLTMQQYERFLAPFSFCKEIEEWLDAHTGGWRDLDYIDIYPVISGIQIDDESQMNGGMLWIGYPKLSVRHWPWLYPEVGGHRMCRVNEGEKLPCGFCE